MKSRGLIKDFSKYVSLNVLGMLGISCYILADTFFISVGLGASGIAALNLAIPIFNIVNGSGLMLGMGAATIYSIWRHEGEHEKAKKVFTNSLIFACILCSIFIICGLFFPDQISAALGANDEIIDMTSIYLKVLLLFSPMFFLNNIFTCFVRNDGNPRLTMVATVSGSMFNIVLDYIFIFPLGLGMFGAVLATSLAPIISFAVLSKHKIMRQNSFHLLKTKLEGDIIKKITSLGFPSLFSEFSSGIVIIVFNIIILNILGNIGLAAYGIISNLSLIVVAIYTGIGQGMQPLASIYAGRKDYEELIKVLKYGVISLIGFSVLAYTFIFIFANQITTVFNSEGNQILQGLAVKGLRLYFTAVLFTGLNIVASHFFTAIGIGRPATIITLLRGLIVILPVTIIMSAKFGMIGVWLSFPLTEFLVAFVSSLALVQLLRAEKEIF